jgi:hypothetical protein
MWVAICRGLTVRCFQYQILFNHLTRLRLWKAHSKNRIKMAIRIPKARVVNIGAIAVNVTPDDVLFILGMSLCQ